MRVKPIKYKKRYITLHKSIMNPKFTHKTILANDPWEYTEMWLKRHGYGNKAIFHWQQARHFNEASKLLPLTSSPLTSYYCFLNAVKTLLIVKKVPFSNRHGVFGKSTSNKALLSNEKVIFTTKGILPALCRYLKEPVVEKETYTLKDILYNLPFIHRSYSLTFTSEPELFIPIHDPKFVKKENSNECWFTCKVDERYADGHLISKLPKHFERDFTDPVNFSIRFKKKIKWVGTNDVTKKQSLVRLANKHQRIRKHICFISGLTKLWYIKRAGVDNIINRSPLPLMFAAMHRLSELSRYENILLYKHLNSQHNWLLSEFIRLAPYQFIDEIASEITGEEFMLPGYAKR
jgi:hypothetical protein